MERVSCNLCGSNDHRVVYEKPDVLFHKDDWFTVVECNECGLGFVNPRPGPEEISRHYPTEFFDNFADEAAHNQKRYGIEAGYLSDITGRPGRKLLLDVGCANGDFPRFMRGLGWEVEGVEISPNAREITDFKVYANELSSLPVDEPTYDAVTAWAVLEHVHDPMAYFRKVGRILKPGGRFLFLVTNFSSMSSRHLFCEDVPRHLYFYTEDTVGRYLSSAGLELVSSEFNDRIFEMPPKNWLYHLYSRWIKRRPLRWDETPQSRKNFLKERGMESGVLSTMRYFLSLSPLGMADRALAYFVGWLQMLRGTYGTAMYVAEKPSVSMKNDRA